MAQREIILLKTVIFHH